MSRGCFPKLLVLFSQLSIPLYSVSGGLHHCGLYCLVTGTTMDPLQMLLEALEQVYVSQLISLIYITISAVSTSYAFIDHSFAFPSTKSLVYPHKKLCYG